MLNGTLDTFSVTEILELVGAAGASGVLHVRSDLDVGSVRCDAGAVSFATVGEDVDLGSVLVRGGFVRAPEWQALDGTDDPVVELKGLLARHEVDTDHLQRYLATQTEESVFELDCWRAGELRLETDDVRWLDGIFRYPTGPLLKSIGKRKREWQHLVGALGSPDHVVHQAPMRVDDDAEMSISRSQLALLSHVDGSRSVRELARHLGTGLFHTGKMVAALAEIGLVTLRTDRAASNGASSNGAASNGAPAERVATEPSARPTPQPDPEPAPGASVDGPAEFVEAGEGPARDLIVRLLSAVKEEL